MKPVLLIEFVLPAMNHFQHLPGIFFCKWLQRIQSFSVLCQSYRHNGNAFQKRKIAAQIPDTPLQFFPVINAFAQNNLPVHLNAALVQNIYFFQRVPGKTVMKHSAAQFRICSMKRNVDRLQTISDNPLHIPVTHICQGNIISLEKRQPGIIIFKIQRIPHSRWHLINKAEDAFIPAGMILIHQALIKCNSQLFIRILFDFQFPFFPILLFNQKQQFFLFHVKLIIKNIFYLMSVN